MPRTSPHVLAATAVGGAVGALVRWAIASATATPDAFPWATFAINVLGSMALALLILRGPTSDLWRTALGPGLLGGFTTMSAYAVELRALLADDRLIAAAGYAVGTLLCAVGAVAVVQRALGPDARSSGGTA